MHVKCKAYLSMIELSVTTAISETTPTATVALYYIC